MDKQGISINQPMPFFIKASEGNVVIDTAYVVKDRYELQTYIEKNNITLLCMAKSIAVQNRMRHEITLMDLPNFTDDKPVVITHEKFVSLNDKVQTWFVPFVVAMIMMPITIVFAVMAAASLLLMLCSFLTDRRLHFTEGMRLAAASYMPIAIIGFFVDVPIILSVLFWLGYAFFGLHAAGKNDKAEWTSIA